jgi:hypothetical protein
MRISLTLKTTKSIVLQVNYSLLLLVFFVNFTLFFIEQFNFFNNFNGKQQDTNLNKASINNNNFNSMMMMNKTESACDKYAALKDLDEQFKEAKQAEVAVVQSQDEANGNFHLYILAI